MSSNKMIQKFNAALKGKRLSDVGFGNNAGLNLHFEGWSFLLFSSYWRVASKHTILAGSFDETAIALKKLALLKECTFESLSILNTSFDAIIKFSNKATLQIFNPSVKEHKGWLLFTPDAMVFSTGPGALYQYEESI